LYLENVLSALQTFHLPPAQLKRIKIVENQKIPDSKAESKGDPEFKGTNFPDLLRHKVGIHFLKRK
jgi:hypothetical protein